MDDLLRGAWESQISHNRVLTARMREDLSVSDFNTILRVTIPAKWSNANRSDKPDHIATAME
jgi:hypothetical protein